MVSEPMGTNKERIERLETGLGGVQDGLQKMELGMADKFHHLETTLNRFSDILLSNQESSSHNYQSHEGNNGGRQVVSSKTAKLEFPRFAGDDPTEWFNRVNQFFEFQNTPEIHKVSLAAYHLEGEANQWWQWLRRTLQEEGRALSWTSFEDELWTRFGPSECEDFDEALSRVRQTGSLRDYQRTFERYGNRVRGWTQKALVGTFMGGLKSEISDGIRMFKPRTLQEAIGLARMKDDQLARQRRIVAPTPLVRPPSALPPINQTALPAPAPTARRLTWEEMQRRRAQGLCFNCDERFTARHKCQGPRLLLLEGFDDNNNHTSDGSPEGPPTDASPEEFSEPEITLYALAGWTAPKTMRVAARIGSHDVIVLIDSGSTHNFISERLANQLRLPVVPTETFTVRVANGEHLKCHGWFEKVPVDIQGILFPLTLYSLPLTGLDLVLGVQWLELLGSVVCNWKQLTMEFTWANQTKTLRGLDGQGIQEASLQEISKAICTGHTLLAVCLQVVHLDPQEKIHPSMQELLREFADLFVEPSSLPPTREVEHSISLKEGTEPVNVRPYSSTGMTPFQALYGRLPPSIPTYNEGLSPVHEVDQQLLNRDELLRHLKTNLEKSVTRMKHMADKKRRDISFEPGDQVLLKLHPYRQQTAFKRVHQKLASRFYGPYPILEKIGAVAYKLQLPEGTRIHPVFHVSLLKQYQETGHSDAPQPAELPPFTDDGVAILAPHAILDTRWLKQGNHLVEESLVQWKHLPAEDATWEPTQKLLALYPHMDLEDKDPLDGGGIDKPRRSERGPRPNPKYLE
ncbi:hypothetical protein F0562_023274 [Nyssa sinensis]|uniref:Uncharacterized protein n=1 Tax=Nyssa sinensis TaxID=561372 RepID=A0A5J5BK90_9ASTE|nr:hypothetical protein F0562_023274 [Nyssa sinensis]